MKIISGGQLGVDRAALDVAMKLGYPTGGWCPKDRRALDGRIPSKYNLTELDSPDYKDRTMANVRDSDYTIIVAHRADSLTPGSKATQYYCRRLGKPYAIVELGVHFYMPKIKTLHIAGSSSLHNAEGYLSDMLYFADTIGPNEKSHPYKYIVQGPAFDWILTEGTWCTFLKGGLYLRGSIYAGGLYLRQNKLVTLPGTRLILSTKHRQFEGIQGVSRAYFLNDDT